MKEISVKFLFCFLYGVGDAYGEDRLFGHVRFVRLLKRDVSSQLDVSLEFGREIYAEDTDV